MKLRKNRRMADMSNDITGHLVRDMELRKAMLQSENSMMKPEEDLPVLLKDQITKELKDPQMQAEYKSGPEGKRRVLEHFRNMGTQVDRLHKLKQLEAKVLERERAWVRGGDEISRYEHVIDDVEYGEEIDALDNSQLISKALQNEKDDDALSSANIVEGEYRKFLSRMGGTVDTSDVMSGLPQFQHLPPEIQRNKEKLKDIEESMNLHAKTPAGGFGSEPREAEVTQPRQVVDPRLLEGTDNANNIIDANQTDPELPPWPSQEELMQDPDYIPVGEDALQAEEDFGDLSPFSIQLRAERLRKAQDDEHYRATLAGTNLTPMPIFIRDWLIAQVKFGHPIPDSVVQPYCPKGMAIHEYLIAEGILPEEGEVLSEEAAAVDDVVNEVDPEAQLTERVPGSDCTSLREAVEKGHLGCLSVLCDPSHGLAVNGETPLHIASILENVGVARELLDKKICTINAASKSRSTPLHMAALRGHMEMIKLLVQRGAKVNAGDDDGLTPIHLAIAGGSASTSVVNYLIDQKANLQLGDNQGATPLHVAADAGKYNMVKLLLNRGAAINDGTAERETALFLACEQGHIDVVRLLLANGADPNLNNQTGFYPLHAAAQKGSLQIVDILLKAKANPYAKDAGEHTALHIAVLGGHHEICKHLIAGGCPIAEVTSEGWTALHIACQIGSTAIVTLLLDVGSNPDVRNDEGSTPLHIALSACQFHVIPSLLDRSANLNLPDANGVTPLLLAVQEGRADVAQTLLNRGAKPNVLTTDHVSPLHLALEEGLWGLAQVFLDHGLSPIQETLEGYQPIHIVTAQGNLEWIQKLIDLGANPNALTQAGVTPLNIALEHGDKRVEALLRNSGAREMDIFAWMELEEEAKRRRQIAAKETKSTSPLAQ